MRGVGEFSGKKTFDFLFSLLGLVISLPFWVIVYIAIHTEDSGPAYFLQERIGKDGRRFQTIKFRTMKVPGDKSYLDIDLKEDPRVTRVGNILRASGLDELPQLINILRGDLSFVGPRALPLKIEDEERFRYKSIEEIPGYCLRSKVRPGLTGLAQIYAPKDISRRNKFRYDNLYIKRMSFWLDMKLIFLSLWITLRGKWESRGKKI